MASPENRHCANCIGTLSLPIAIDLQSAQLTNNDKILEANCWHCWMLFMLSFCAAAAEGVTILLSLTVFLLLVAESMPPTSDAVPLIGQFLP